MAQLKGMKEICKHSRRSEATILSFINQYRGTENAFPAYRIKPSMIWTADSKQIDDWFEKMSSPQSQTGVEAPIQKRDVKTFKSRRFGG